MNAQETSRLIQRLVRDLSAVRRIPPLRAAAAGVALLGLGAGAIGLAGLGPRGDLPHVLLHSPSFTAVLLGLGAVALGGVLAGLAGSVPGREDAARLGGFAAIAGAAVAAAAAVGLLLAGGGPAPPLAKDAECVGLACVLALAPALGLLAFLARGAPLRPTAAALGAAAGCVAIGAFAVHLGCPYASARHLLLGHALAPAFGMVLLALPLRAALALARG